MDNELFPDPCIFQLLLELFLDRMMFVGEFFSVWVAVVLEDVLECLHWQPLWLGDFTLVLSLGDDNEVTNDGDIIGGGVFEILCEIVEFLVVVEDLVLDLGLFTGVRCLSMVADKLELVLLGVEWLLLIDCLTGLTTLLINLKTYVKIKGHRTI